MSKSGSTLSSPLQEAAIGQQPVRGPQFSGGRAEPRLFQLCTWLALGSLAVYCFGGGLWVAIGSTQMLHNQWENTHPEGPHVFVALQAARTGHLYFSFSDSPYVVQSYGPLYYAINGLIAWASHAQLEPMVLHARELSYACYLLSGLMVFLICRKAGASLLLSALAAMMMFGQPDFFSWNITVRPDMLYLAAMLVGLYFAMKADDQGWAYYALSGGFAGLACVIKQPGIATVIAILFVLAIKREFREVLLFCLGAVLPVVAMFGWLLWRKEPFLEQFTAVSKGFWSTADAIQFLGTYFSQIIRFVPLTIGVLGFVKAVRLDKTWQIIASFAAVNWIVCLSGLPQVGSGSNYFLPGWAGCAMLLPAAVEWFRQHARMAPSMLLASVALVWTACASISSDRDLAHWYSAPSHISYAPLAPYRIISLYSLVALYGHDPDLLDSFAIHALELKGYWNAEPVITNIKQGNYDLVIFERLEIPRIVPSYRSVSDYGQNVVDALNQNYVVLCATMRSVILRPRNRQVQLSPDFFSGMFATQCAPGLPDASPHLRLAPNVK